MVSKTWKAMLVAAATGSLSMISAAEAPQSNVSAAAAPQMFTQMNADQYRAFTMKEQHLDNTALSLTAAQRSEIEKIVTAYSAEQVASNAKNPIANDARSNQAVLATRQAARTNMTIAIGRVLNEGQRKTWTSSKSARLGSSKLSDPPSMAPLTR